MTDRWTDLLDCLVLKPVGDQAYEGRSQQLPYHRLYGGQLLAQFVQAACLTAPGKAVKSLHTVFVREGSSEEPVRYTTDCPHQGRSFATVRLEAAQGHRTVAVATASMHTWEDGPDRQTAAPLPDLPGPEHALSLDLLPFQARSHADLDAPAVGPPTLDLWLRTPPVAPELGPALLAYATDLTLIGTALRPVDGLSQRDAGGAFASAVTSHTVWFHRPLRTDDWLLLRQRSPLAAHGRAYGLGDVLSRQGALTAAFAQEALLRFRD